MVLRTSFRNLHILQLTTIFGNQVENVGYETAQIVVTTKDFIDLPIFDSDRGSAPTVN